MSKRINPKVYRVILLIDTSGSFGRRFLTGIAQYGSTHTFDFIGYQKGVLLSNLTDIEADGVIMYYSRKNENLMTKKRPVIMLGPPEKVDDFPHVRTDFISVGTKCAEYFLSKGFRHFAFCGDTACARSQEYGEFFSKRIAEAGFNSHIYKQPYVHMWIKERPFMIEWLKSLSKPVGLMACNDERAQYIIDACKFANIMIPDEIAIVGVDNDELICNLTKPHLSSLNLNMEKAGYESAELLHKFIEGQKMAKQEIIIEPLYVIDRQSTDILAIEDPEVSQAIRFIREQTKEPIQVSNVADAVGVSRRNLERRFQKRLDSSILEEIKRARVHQIKRLLLETKLSIFEISFILKFPSLSKLSRFFQHATGTGPLEYRKLHRPK